MTTWSQATSCSTPNCGHPPEWHRGNGLMPDVSFGCAGCNCGGLTRSMPGLLSAAPPAPSTWVGGNASLVVRAGVHEEGYPVVVLEARGAHGELLRVMLTEADVAMVQAGLETGWQQAREMARGDSAESPS